MLARLGQPGLDGARPGLGVPDRIAGGQGDPADHPVGDGRLRARRPHHALLAAQREVPQRVAVPVLVEQGPQPLLVLLGQRVDRPAGAEGGEEHRDQQQRGQDVDGDVDPAGRGDPGEPLVVGGQRDEPHQAVAPALQEGGVPGGGVGDGDQDGREQRGDEQPADRHDRGEQRVGAVALRVELLAAEQQREHEGGGQDQRDPVLGVPPDLREEHHQGEEQQEQPAEHQVEDPRGPLAAAHGDRQEEGEEPRGETGRQQVRGEVVVLVVAAQVLSERDPDGTQEIDERDDAQVPDGERGAAPRTDGGAPGRSFGGQTDLSHEKRSYGAPLVVRRRRRRPHARRVRPPRRRSESAVLPVRPRESPGCRRRRPEWSDPDARAAPRRTPPRPGPGGARAVPRFPRPHGRRGRAAG